MDTVTEHRMAIEWRFRGIGIIHYNNTIDEHMEQVKR